MFRSEIIERRVVVSPDEIRRNVADGDVDKSLLIDRILLKKTTGLTLDTYFPAPKLVELLSKKNKIKKK